MSARAPTISAVDVALLRTVARARSVVAASRQVGIFRDRATYRIARLERAFGGPVIASVRGGRGHGGSHLTALGDRIVREGFDAVELLNARPVAPLFPANVVRGVYRIGPPPEVVLPGGDRWRVAFAAEDGEPVAAHLDPEAILVARRRFPSSARNVVRGRVARLDPGPGGPGSTIAVAVGGQRLRVAITPEAVRQLRLARGATVWLYVKATSLRRVARAGRAPTPGSRPS